MDTAAFVHVRFPDMVPSCLELEASAPSGAARRPPAMTAMKARRGISGEQRVSMWSLAASLPVSAGMRRRDVFLAKKRKAA